MQINPRQILNDGVRKHLVRQIAIALHENLIFDVKASGRKDPKVRAGVLPHTSRVSFLSLDA